MLVVAVYQDLVGGIGRVEYGILVGELMNEEFKRSEGEVVAGGRRLQHVVLEASLEILDAVVLLFAQ